MKKLTIFTCFLLALTALRAQDANGLVKMDAASSGNTYSMVTINESYMLGIASEGDTEGYYFDGPFNRYITIDTGNCEGEMAMSLYFEEFDIDPGDTLFIHDGASISSPVLLTCNNNLNPQYHTTIFASPLNTSGKLTLRFKTNGDGNNGIGFRISVRCRDKCETITPVIDSFFFKTRNGVIIDTGYTRMAIQVDTSWNADSSQFTLDTEWFRGVHLCLGEGVIFSAHGEYTNYYGYGPGDAWSEFEWQFGNGDDSTGIGLTYVPARYRDLDCYDVTLRITDSRGCKSTIMESVRVRIAQNPIKTIYDLNPMCTTDSSLVNIGYEGSNATISMQHITFNKAKSRSIACKTFIPDGQNQNCEMADKEDCFQAPITFDDFPSGRTVMSGADICSVCINWEHSYLGDTRVHLICPTGQKATLWYGQSGHDPALATMTEDDRKNLPVGSYNGGYQLIGIPYGGSSDGYGDSHCPSGTNPSGGSWNTKCDSVCNMYGIGYDYCFSMNGDYRTQRGEPCNTGDAIPADYYCSQANHVPFTQSFDPIPAPFGNAGQAAPDNTSETKAPSNHEAKTGYYLPAKDFDELEGCPLNGDWSIQVCDNWPSDNGWIFSWSLDFCGISAGGGCEYQVGIDSVVWLPDSNYGDFDLGHWRGLYIDNKEPTRSVIRTPDTAGYFPINVKIYDEFGCVWDTTTGITTVWAPTPELGDARLICDVENVVLDASDRHTDTNYTFMWEPYGQTTDTITTTAMVGSSTMYTVEVEHHQAGITCATRDSVRVNINRQPLPNFDPGVYPLEGCEPYTIHFENTSQFGDKYLWVFGDGDSSRQMSPSHTYGTGQYNFKYFVESESGCTDSLVYNKLITVYSSPVARFSWEPMNPTVMHPSVTFHNLTKPQSDDNIYYWEIQYDKDNHVSYHTMKEVNPTFEWPATEGEDLTGNYVARLIAMTKTMGPSGKIVECRDTVENSILLVNDFLQFPNAVTPNGDGVNDKFIIKNLVDGLGYPNNSLAIYDRWGKRVYYKENIAKEEDFWDPAADNIPDGTYFWRFVGKGYLGDIQRNGVVEVIR